MEDLDVDELTDVELIFFLGEGTEIQVATIEAWLRGHLEDLEGELLAGQPDPAPLLCGAGA